jgi:hypothetical protein
MTDNMRGRRRLMRLGAGLVLVAGSAGSLCLAAGTASADSTTTFDATASAYGFDAVIANKTIPAGISPEAAGPVAQSELSSLPAGTSFASFPYPGDVVAGVPGLLSSIVMNLPQPPAYPLITTSGLSQGKQTANEPGIGLSADTETSDAEAHAVFGTDGTGAVADSKIVVDPQNGVTATATTSDNAITLGSLGDIGSVTSSATATQASDGTVTSTSSIAVTGLNIPVLQLTIPKGSPTLAPIQGLPIPSIPIPFGGTTLNAPSIGFVDGEFTIELPLLGKTQFVLPAQTALSALKAAGIDATYSQPIKTKTGIVGAALSLKYVVPSPPKGLEISGPTDVTMTFGDTSASIKGSMDAGTGSITPGSGKVTGTTPGGTSSTVPAVGSSGGGASGLPGVGGTSSLPAGSSSEPGSAPVVASGAQPAVGLTASRLVNPRSPLSWSLYLVLVAAALAGTYSTQTLRLLGVRRK